MSVPVTSAMYATGAGKKIITLVLLSIVLFPAFPTADLMIQSALNPLTQQPLVLSDTAMKGDQSTNPGHFTKNLLDNTTCPTYDESQWFGTATVREGRDLFYWYAESRNNPDEDPIIIWLNGGPGGAFVSGVFLGPGPCLLEPNATQAHPNPLSWTNNASMLYIDQPAGTGFSNLAEGFPVPNNDQDAAKDLFTFLDIFFTDIFPEQNTRPIHIAGISYFGHYGPVYMEHILRYQHKLRFKGNLTSLIMVNSLFNWTSTFTGSYDLLCKERTKVGLLNATACNYIADSLPEQRRLGHKCDLDYGGKSCIAAYNHGQNIVAAPVLDLVKTQNFYLANINISCVPTTSYPYCADPASANLTGFINQDWVKKALGKPSSFMFQHVNMDIHRAFRETGSFMSPRTRELAYVLESGVRVMALNGNLDYLVNTPGIIRAYNALQWSGRSEIRAGIWRSLPESVRAQGSWKATSDGRLTLVAVDGGGHDVLGYVKEGSMDIVRDWIQGGWKT